MCLMFMPSLEKRGQLKSILLGKSKCVQTPWKGKTDTKTIKTFIIYIYIYPWLYPFAGGHNGVVWGGVGWGGVGMMTFLAHEHIFDGWGWWRSLHMNTSLMLRRWCRSLHMNTSLMLRRTGVGWGWWRSLHMNTSLMLRRWWRSLRMNTSLMLRRWCRSLHMNTSLLLQHCTESLA